jgi:hypothetical protein
MLRRCVSAAVVLFIFGGFVFAETYKHAHIVKLDDGSVTFKYKKDKAEKAEKKTIKLGEKVAITQKLKDETPTITTKDLTGLIEKGHKDKDDKVHKGVIAKIETKGEGDDEMVVSIEVHQQTGKKKADTDKKDDK